jgi:hypothetical protein
MFLLQYLINNILYEHCLHYTTHELLFISCPSLTSAPTEDLDPICMVVLLGGLC